MSGVYGALFVVGILLSAWMWDRLGRGEVQRGRLTLVYFGGLVGALLGAKLGFLVAEGWHYRGDWMALVSGRTITGALLGGYGGVEIAKRMLGHREATGDAFALVVPVALIIGRVGCLLQGCCPGVVCEEAWWSVADQHGLHRWPAAHAELGFNLLFLAWCLVATRVRWLPGNRFHVYLVAYGVFRFGHEFARDDVEWARGVTGYHLLALGLVALGVARWRTPAKPSAP